MTSLKWIKWYCIDKTGDGQVQISCATVWSYSSTPFLFFFSLFFCYKKPTLDEESVVCRYAEPNAL